MTASARRGILTYYRCTGFHGGCGNAYIREELLADLLGDVVKRIQIPTKLADWIADGLRESQGDVEQARQVAVAQLTQRCRAVQANPRLRRDRRKS